MNQGDREQQHAKQLEELIQEKQSTVTPLEHLIELKKKEIASLTNTLEQRAENKELDQLQTQLYKLWDNFRDREDKLKRSFEVEPTIIRLLTEVIEMKHLYLNKVEQIQRDVQREVREGSWFKNKKKQVTKIIYDKKVIKVKPEINQIESGEWSVEGFLPEKDGYRLTVTVEMVKIHDRYSSFSVQAWLSDSNGRYKDQKGHWMYPNCQMCSEGASLEDELLEVLSQVCK